MNDKSFKKITILNNDLCIHHSGLLVYRFCFKNSCFRYKYREQ